MITVETVQSLMDSRPDLIEGLFTGTRAVAKTKAFTDLYRFRMIASCDPVRWAQAVRDRDSLTSEAWELRFSTWESEEVRDMLTDISTHRRTVSDIDNVTVGDKDTRTVEDIPESTDAELDRFLSSRTKTDRSVDSNDSRDIDERITDGAGLEVITRLMDLYPTPYKDWAEQFGDLFLDRW